MIAPEGFGIVSWSWRQVRQKFWRRLFPELRPFHTVKEWVLFELVDCVVGAQTFIWVMN